MKKSCLIMLSISIIVLLASCGEKKQIKKSVRPVRVVKASVQKANLADIILPATINEFKEVNLAFRVGGPLIKLNNIVGKYVKKGEVIAQIDPRDFRIAVESAKAMYVQAKAEFLRHKNLYAKSSISKSLYDQMETNYLLAKTSYDSAKNSLVDTELKAPFPGYINVVYVENFEEMKPGAPVVSFLDLSKFEVDAWISSKDLNKIDSNSEFVCTVNNGKEHRLIGKLNEVGSKSSFSKQSYQISILIDAPKDLKIRAGMSASIEIMSSNTDSNTAFLLPVSSVFSKDAKSYVWIYNDTLKTVSLKQVTLGSIVFEDMIQITSGLRGGEEIVTAGVHYLFEGQEVKRILNVSKSNVGNQL